MVNRLIESLLAGALGAAIGYLAGSLLAAPFDAGSGIGIAAAVVAGINGVLAGYRGIYAWTTPGGALAFLLDSSWALISTTLGVIVNLINLVNRRSGFSPEYSVRKNRFVYQRGFALKRGFANTQGPVVSNAGLGRDEPLINRHNLIERHEGLHVWQQRWFGPLHPITYIVWGVFAAVVALVFGVFSRERRRRGVRIGKLMETAAYYDNPFEYWAYQSDERWDTNSAHPRLKWGKFSWDR